MSDYLTHNERRKAAHVSGTYPVLDMPITVERETVAGVEIERTDAAGVESIEITGERPAFIRRQTRALFESAYARALDEAFVNDPSMPAFLRRQCDL